MIKLHKAKQTPIKMTAFIMDELKKMDRLHQYLFPTRDILQLCKYYYCGKLGIEYKASICVFLTTPSEPTINL